MNLKLVLGISLGALVSQALAAPINIQDANDGINIFLHSALFLIYRCSVI
jgi:hypothetical protein